MFAKLTILASIAIASQAVNIGNETALTATGDFSDMSYLENAGAFKEAEARRQVFLAKHMKLVEARAAAAHHYYSAKDAAAEKTRILGDWNNRWLASVEAHKQAMEHHAKMTAAEKKAFDAKIAATAAHLTATEGVATAAKGVAKAGAGVHTAQMNVAQALTAYVAIKAEQSKRDYVNHMEEINAAVAKINAFRAHVKALKAALAARKVELAASIKAMVVAKANHMSAKGVEAKAAAEQTAATKAHESAKADTAEAKKDLEAAAAAKRRANIGLGHASDDRKEAILLKAAALAKAKVASNAVRSHVQKNGSFAL